MTTNELIRPAGNRALQVNPPNADINLGRWGSDWGWVVFCIMAASTIGLLIWSLRMPRGRRTFPYLLTAVLAISTISWYSQASDLGATPIQVQFLRNSPLAPDGGYPTRQIWYSRYIDWALTVPLLLLSLLLITGLPLSLIFITLFFSMFMVVCGLLGALTRTRYKWGYFVSAMQTQCSSSTFGFAQAANLLALRLRSTGLRLRGTWLRLVPRLRIWPAFGPTTRPRFRACLPRCFDVARHHLASVPSVLGLDPWWKRHRRQLGGESNFYTSQDVLLRRGCPHLSPALSLPCTDRFAPLAISQHSSFGLVSWTSSRSRSMRSCSSPCYVSATTARFASDRARSPKARSRITSNDEASSAKRARRTSVLPRSTMSEAAVRTLPQLRLIPLWPPLPLSPLLAPQCLLVLPSDQAPSQCCRTRFPL